MQMSVRFVVVVDESKLVPTLGAFGLPLEVLPFAEGIVAERVRALGASEIQRQPEPTDNGNVLLLANFGAIANAATLATQLQAIPGLFEHGLFLKEWVERVVVGGANGVREIPIGA